MSQNAQRLTWKEEEVDSKLQDMMSEMQSQAVERDERLRSLIEENQSSSAASSSSAHWRVFFGLIEGWGRDFLPLRVRLRLNFLLGLTRLGCVRGTGGRFDFFCLILLHFVCSRVRISGWY